MIAVIIGVADVQDNVTEPNEIIAKKFKDEHGLDIPANDIKNPKKFEFYYSRVRDEWLIRKLETRDD